MARTERSESREQTGRAKRVPLGVARTKLTVAERKGYKRRWVNATDNRIQQAQMGGYELVTDPDKKLEVGATGDRNSDLGSAVSQIVGTQKDGSPLRAYLMEIPEEDYRADQEAKQKQLDEIDETIRRGNVNGKVGQDGRYVPTSGIKYD